MENAYSKVSLFREYSLYEDNTKECVSLRMCSIVWLNLATTDFSSMSCLSYHPVGVYKTIRIELLSETFTLSFIYSTSSSDISSAPMDLDESIKLILMCVILISLILAFSSLIEG